MDDQIKQTVIKNLAKDYKAVYKELGFIEDENGLPDIEAQVRATNGLMIYLSQFEGHRDSLLPKVQDQPTVAVEKAEAALNSVNPSQTPTAPPPTPQPKEIPEQVDFKGQPLPPYTRSTMKWIRCPECGNTDIDCYSEKKEKEYQACFTCKLFLNSDGRATDMETGEQRGKIW